MRIKKYGTNLINKQGPKFKAYNEVLDFIEKLFIEKPYLTFKKAYHELLLKFNIGKNEMSIDTVRKRFKKEKGFTRKRMVKVKERAVSKYNLHLRKRFVQLFLPYLQAESEGLVDIWYLDEAGFNLDQSPAYGWSKKGQLPVVKVPIKIVNTSLLMAISLNKGIYYQFFEGGVRG